MANVDRVDILGGVAAWRWRDKFDSMVPHVRRDSHSPRSIAIVDIGNLCLNAIQAEAQQQESRDQSANAHHSDNDHAGMIIA